MTTRDRITAWSAPGTEPLPGPVTDARDLVLLRADDRRYPADETSLMHTLGYTDHRLAIVHGEPKPDELVSKGLDGEAHHDAGRPCRPGIATQEHDRPGPDGVQADRVHGARRGAGAGDTTAALKGPDATGRTEPPGRGGLGSAVLG